MIKGVSALGQVEGTADESWNNYLDREARLRRSAHTASGFEGAQRILQKLLTMRGAWEYRAGVLR